MTQHEQRGRSFELSVEVPGTPEEVWRAIATGPGISSWYVPHQVQEQAGGVAVASFGDSPEMQISGRVAAWDPPRRIVFDGGEGVDGLAFEWLIEARTGDTCVVRLINSGFGSGAEWDAQFDGLQEGWPLFLRNLQLHLTHFGGQTATSALPMAPWAGAPDEAWDRLMQALGVPADAGESDRLVLQATGSPRLAGTVIEQAQRRLALLVDEPAPGTAFIAAEHLGDASGVSIWSYLYGPEGAEAASQDGPAWQAWLHSHAEA